MAIMPDRWEMEQEARERRERKKAQDRDKKKFIKKWISLTPEQQAEIVWKIKQQLDVVGEEAHSTNLRRRQI